MKAKLKTKEFDCLDPKHTYSNDGANILTLYFVNVESLDELKSEITDCNHIEVTYDDGSILNFDDYIYCVGSSDEGGIVSYVLQQPSLVQQVENQRVIINDLRAVINEQAQLIRELQGTQADQDDAINFLLMGEEDLTDGEIPSETDSER